VVSVTEPSGRISRFSRQEPLLFYRVAPQFERYDIRGKYHPYHRAGERALGCVLDNATKATLYSHI
jgi:hypothetical protein